MRYFIYEVLPGVMGYRGIMSFVSGEQENTSKNEGNRGTKVILGAGNTENKDFDFGEQRKMLKYFRGTREQVHPLRIPWEGLIYYLYIYLFTTAIYK